MSLYQHTQTAEVRDLAPELIAGWAASGNPKAALWVPYTPPPAAPVAYSPAEYAAEIQHRLDLAAQARNYDGIVSACSYAGFANLFQNEGIAFGQWRSAVWAFVYAAQQQPPAGPAPTPTQFADYVFSQIPAPTF